MLHVQNILLIRCIVVVFYRSRCLHHVFNVTRFYITESSRSFPAFPSRTFYLTTGTLDLLRYILDNFCFLNSDQKKLCRFPNSSALRKIERALRLAVTLRSCQFSHFSPCYSPLFENAGPIESTSFSVFVLARVL